MESENEDEDFESEISSDEDVVGDQGNILRDCRDLGETSVGFNVAEGQNRPDGNLKEASDVDEQVLRGRLLSQSAGHDSETSARRPKRMSDDIEDSSEEERRKKKIAKGRACKVLVLN